MMQSRPGIDPDISEWKGQDITDFQEDLRLKVNGQLSEKWFYTHMKGSSSSLPRIDVLNMLSKYAGYKNWGDFKFRNAVSVPLKDSQKAGNLILILIPSAVLLTVIAIIILRTVSIHSYKITFIDSDTGEPIISSSIRAEVILGNQPPEYLVSDEKGNIIIRTNKSTAEMIVKAPYYQTETIRGTLIKFKNNKVISLRPDYYALMISYYSNSDVSSWENRREKLNEIISEEAIIYQFPLEGAASGMAIFNKWEFIDKITIPTSGLQNIEILDCHYRNGKIVLLRIRNNAEKQ